MADPNMNTAQSLTRLSDADYEVAPGEPDVRGWDVVLGNDEHIGEVDDLLIDPAAGKVRYLDVDLEAKAMGLDRHRHVLIPIAGAELDATDNEVVLNGMSRAALLRLPEYDGRTLAGGYDRTFQSQLDDQFTTRRVTRSAEELRIGKRSQKLGDVHVSKHVETDRVKQTVPLRRDEVHVERRPVDRAAGPSEMRNEEIVIPAIEEEAVIEKRPVVKEEFVISKERRTIPKTVETDVRREEVDVKPSSGNVRVKDDTRGRGGE